MVRTGIGIAGFALLGLVGCNKTPEDPGLTATASASAGSATDTDGGSESIEDEDESVTETQGVTSTSGPAEESSGPAEESSGAPMTTEPQTTGEPGGCGDGMVVPGEQCDGADLQGFDCASLGLGGGTLACDPVTCSFDTSMCMSTSSGTSG